MASSYPMLRYGSSGQEVRRLQQALNRAGYSLEVDGGFGEKTRAALMDYQRRAGMTPDGVAGSKTWASLGLQSAQDRLADLEKGYTPSRETQEARRSWEELAARQPGDYTSPYADRMEDLLRQMESREAFSYDPSRDEMFRRYARLYQRQGQTAMEDTLGQAAGLTGGYDSSYARQAGQQEYNRYMQQLSGADEVLCQPGQAGTGRGPGPAEAGGLRRQERQRPLLLRRQQEGVFELHRQREPGADHEHLSQPGGYRPGKATVFAVPGPDDAPAEAAV